MMYKYQATYFGTVDLCPLGFIFSCKIIPIAYPEVSLNSGLCSDLCRESSGWVLALLFVVVVLLFHFASPHVYFYSNPLLSLFWPCFGSLSTFSTVSFTPLVLSSFTTPALIPEANASNTQFWPAKTFLVYIKGKLYGELNKADFYPLEVTDGPEMAVCHWRPYMSPSLPLLQIQNNKYKYKTKETVIVMLLMRCMIILFAFFFVFVFFLFETKLCISNKILLCENISLGLWIFGCFFSACRLSFDHEIVQELHWAAVTCQIGVNTWRKSRFELFCVLRNSTISTLISLLCAELWSGAPNLPFTHSTVMNNDKKIRIVSNVEDDTRAPYNGDSESHY